jgi:predicted DNA-binding protein with PD1-like motif
MRAKLIHESHGQRTFAVVLDKGDEVMASLMRFGEQVEVLSLLGDIGVEESGKPALHLHAVLGRRDGSTVGGHLLEAHVRPTLEVVVTESPAHLRRRKDPETGITLIRL